MAEGPSPEELAALQEQLAALSIHDFLVSAASTVVSLGFAKLEKHDLPETKRAIDALASLLPHLEGEVRQELQLALTRLQVEYATAAAS